MVVSKVFSQGFVTPHSAPSVSFQVKLSILHSNFQRLSIWIKPFSFKEVMNCQF